jgi:hypothetical protein
MSDYVDTILKPNMDYLPSYVKDTTDFIKKLQNFSNIGKNSYLMRLDVTSFYSYIPHVMMRVSMLVNILWKMVYVAMFCLFFFYNHGFSMFLKLAA